jgi:hypothetical protein
MARFAGHATVLSSDSKPATNFLGFAGSAHCLSDDKPKEKTAHRTDYEPSIHEKFSHCTYSLLFGCHCVPIIARTWQ